MSKKQDLKLNELVEKLEECLSQLESGDLELEESLKVYSKAVDLLAQCRNKINDSDVKIQELMGKIESDTYVEDEISHA